MKETFTVKNFSAHSMGLIHTINQILVGYATQGYDLSLRQLYYQLVSRNIVPNTEKSYKNIGNLVSDARMSGMIDWDMIKDRGREMLANPHWNDPVDFIECVAPQYRFDLWKDQPNYVEVMVEKQALEGVLIPVCRRYDVPFTANKGYSSSSAMYEASKRFLQRAQQGKELYIIYLGDHDPSGIDMTRDVKSRLDLFLHCQGDFSANESPQVIVIRAALNMNQIKILKPPRNPAKLTDTRAAGYISMFGSASWELDAIEPKKLAELVSREIISLMDFKLFVKNERKLLQGRKELLAFAKTYGKE